ncbi:acyl-CoA thioesterase [Pseudomonas rubra]|uniref:Acyl-CoA thioesterase n=1 Tax=Pseudomonas rubra TaxID=2942627 RepID=A0ABT5P268_9PSED|nr:thioesterase family protein [Pseudomonas rubra]MDD1012375.1 acyl-CoA thioesterase [Pseudomonas rubra]MDD1037278.1 acyl-CoA thioesterase [Pseudomonas rubra]MDD1152995.1 acyl-CoA thioesterase [Pseudomonas rubra]
MSELPQRQDYPYLHPILTRWQDSDPNGHIAGATVYAYFDTAIQAYLLQQAGLDLQEGEVAGFVVSSAADFFALSAFPDTLEVGLRVARLAGSSVEYQLALLRVEDGQPCAAGKVVQVFVERESGRPAQLPATLQAALERLQG